MRTLKTGNFLQYQFSNTEFQIEDDTDNTRTLNFNASSIPTSTNVTLYPPPASTTIVGTNSIQSLSNKIINANCNSITNVIASGLSGILPVVNGGSGLSSVALNGVLIGNASSTPSVQVLSGAIVDSFSIQSLSNKIINGACNTITNVIASGLSGLLPVPQGGTGLSSITAYSIILGGTTSSNPLQALSSTGTSGQALVSAGANALPIWQNPPSLASNYSFSLTIPTSVTIGVPLSGVSGQNFARDYFTTVQYNNGSMWDAVNGYYTIPTTGIYLITVKLCISEANVATYWDISNNSAPQVYYLRQGYSSAITLGYGPTASSTSALLLTGGSGLYFGFYVGYTTGVAKLDSSPNACLLQVARIG